MQHHTAPRKRRYDSDGEEDKVKVLAEPIKLLVDPRTSARLKEEADIEDCRMVTALENWIMQQPLGDARVVKIWYTCAHRKSRATHRTEAAICETQ